MGPGPKLGPKGAQIWAHGPKIWAQGPKLWAQFWARMVGPSVNPNLGPRGPIGNLGDRTQSCAAKNRAERTGQNSKRRHTYFFKYVASKGNIRGESVGLIINCPRPDIVHPGAPFGIPTWVHGSHVGLPYGIPIWGSHMGIPYGDPMWGSHVGIPYGDPMWGSHMGIPDGNPMWDLGFGEWCPLKDF